MKIQEIGSLNLNETTFKLSDNSITAKVNNKTKAIINDIQSVKSLPFNKKVDLNVKFKSVLNKYFDALYIANDNKLYYFIDNNYHKVIAEFASNGDMDELNKLMEKVNELNGYNVNVLFLNIA